VEVILLGTSSAVPTVRRGLSGLAVVRDGETFLFDCGEGTQFRMLKAEIPRRKLHHIFITHLHGDHVFGLGGLLASLNISERSFPLHIHGPRGIKRFVDFMTSFPRPTRFGFPIHVHEFPPGHRGVAWDHPEYEVVIAPLDHTIPAFGYRLQEKDLLGRFDSAAADRLGIPFGPERGQLQRGETITLPDGRRVEPAEVVGPPRPGKSFVYCTDTAFCADAEELARGADLLVHEATYGDAEEDLARDRKHSTIRQAATVARRAGARRFVATHFSTRYEGPALEALAIEGREVFPELVMAKDLLRIVI
jgi:ribonuclease Z